MAYQGGVYLIVVIACCFCCENILAVTAGVVKGGVLSPLLTPDMIDDFMKQYPVILAFVADWCKKCKEIEPVFIDTMSDLPGFRFGRIDASKHVGQTARFDVVSVPTIFLVKGNDVWRYQGAFSKDALIYFASKGYEKLKPLSVWTSPLGPFGKSKAYCIELGIELMKKINLKSRIGVDVPEWMGFFIIVFCIGTLTFIFTVLSVMRFK